MSTDEFTRDPLLRTFGALLRSYREAADLMCESGAPGACSGRVRAGGKL